MITTFKEFVPLALRTEAPTGHVPIPHARLFHAAIGLSTETGEIFEALGKYALDRVNLSEEIGDCLWYLAIAYDAGFLDITLSDQHQALDIVQVQGALLDVFKRSIFYGRPVDLEELKIQFNIFYVTLLDLADGYNIDLSVSMTNCINKLKKRFPEKFTEADAYERNTEEEYLVLGVNV